MKVSILMDRIFLCPLCLLLFRYMMNLSNRFSVLCYMPPVWLTHLPQFCFTVRSLYSCGLGVFFVCNFVVHSLHSYGPRVGLFVCVFSILLQARSLNLVCNFAVRSLYFCRLGVHLFFGTNSLGSYLGA